ncbi:MAG TPA: sulfotransferase [Anaerolineales bacterium]|nr:sulfotransferase [Anaerolineales bacterium]
MTELDNLPTQESVAAKRSSTILGQVRHQVARWVFRGRIRLGDGGGLEPIAPEDLADIRRRFPRPKFFIFGHPRSGTTFLARLIRIHPEVHCNWQIQYFSNRGPIPYFTSPSFDHWLRNSSNRWVSGWNPTALMLRACCDVILEREGEKAGKDVVGDKSPNGNGAQAVRWLATVYPDAHLIYIVRDGRDAVLSRRVQAFIDQPQNLGFADRRVRRAFLQDPQPFLDQRKSIFTPAWLQRAAGRWAKDVGESVETGRRLFGRQFAVVRYEDLLADPHAAMTRLWLFLGVGGAGGELRGEIAQEFQRNPEAEWHQSFGFDFVGSLPRGVHGGWQSLFTRADQELFERVAGKELEAWDYRQSP